MRKPTESLVRAVAAGGLIYMGLLSSAFGQVAPRPPAQLTIDGIGSTHFDNFEFDASRTGASASVFTSRGWTGIKAENVTGSGSGYIYTQRDTSLGSRVLVLESRPSQSGMTAPGFESGQTDYYLQLGSDSGPTTAIPANVWIQFKTFATTNSSFSRRDKTLYPCRQYYPCPIEGGFLGWLFHWGRGGYEDVDGVPANRYIGVLAERADYQGPGIEYPTNKGKLFQNVSKAQLVAGRWYDLRLHFDTSGPQGIYQAWIREQGQSGWTMVSDWRGGVTPYFNWPIPVSERTGHRVMRIPTTVNGPGDSTVYIDDFVMSTSQSALPN